MNLRLHGSITYIKVSRNLRYSILFSDWMTKFFHHVYLELQINGPSPQVVLLLAGAINHAYRPTADNPSVLITQWDEEERGEC